MPPQNIPLGTDYFKMKTFKIQQKQTKQKQGEREKEWRKKGRKKERKKEKPFKVR